jgi:hypothetical protein
MLSAPPTTDIDQRGWQVCFVPGSNICIATNRNLFDHLVGANEYRCRELHADRLGSLRTTEDAIGDRRPPKVVERIICVGLQATDFRVDTLRINSREAVATSQR